MYPVVMSLSANEIEQEFGQLFDQSAFLQNRCDLRELSGGLTNRNIFMSTPQGRFVARISSNESSYLAIDRNSEFENSKAAADVGIGAKVFDYLPGKGLLVIAYIDGLTLDSPGVNSNLDRIAASCRQLHSAPLFGREFNIFDLQQNYLQIVTDMGFRIPADYQELSGEIKHLKRTLAVNAMPLVPCNNDLLPGNFIDDGEKIWLIDYEYSGNNDRCFELGNIWSEAWLDIEALEQLVHDYFESDNAVQFARAWLYSIMAKYGWTLWASIQDAISPIDFDFWSWGMEKYEDCRSLIASSYYREMLEKALK